MPDTPLFFMPCPLDGKDVAITSDTLRGRRPATCPDDGVQLEIKGGDGLVALLERLRATENRLKLIVH